MDTRRATEERAGVLDNASRSSTERNEVEWPGSRWRSGILLSNAGSQHRKIEEAPRGVYYETVAVGSWGCHRIRKAVSEMEDTARSLPNMAVQIGRVCLKNPVLTASGTFAYGLEFAHLMDLNSIGGIVVKGLSMQPIKGNPPPRIYETPSGMLNAIGWQNIGAVEFVEKKLPALRKYHTNIIVNIVGFELKEYLEVTRYLNDCPGIAALELNISCPNVKQGGFHYNKNPGDTFEITQSTKRASPNLPLWVKLSPNVTDIREFARACEDAGADALSVVNTFVGMAIDIEKRRPRLSYVTGGLSGPAIKPLALRMVWETCKAIKIPVLGIGGISTAEDAVEFLMAGARAIQVGTANFYDPAASEKIALGLAEYCRSHGVEDVNQIIGSLQV